MKKIQLIALLLLAACSPKVDNDGYVRDADWNSIVKVGTTTKQEVQDTFGSPSSVSTFGPETWYYLSAKKETVAFFAPEVVEQNSVRIEFDAAGVVSKMDSYNKDNAKEFALVKRTTPTEGHSLSFFEQIMGNIGRFNKSGSDSPISPGRKPSRPGY